MHFLACAPQTNATYCEDAFYALAINNVSRGANADALFRLS